MSKKVSNINEEPELLSIIDRIGMIYDESKKSGLTDDFFQKIDIDLDVLSKYLKTNKIQAFFIANIISLNLHGSSVNSRDLVEYFGCNPMKMIKYTKELEVLNKNGFLKKVRIRKSRMSNITYDYAINEVVLDAIISEKEIELSKNETCSDIYQVLQSISELWSQVEENEMMAKEAMDELKNIINLYKSLPLLQKIILLDLSIQDCYLFLISIWRTLMGSEEVNLERIIEGISDHNSSKIRYMRTFLSGENQLLIKDLLEVVDNNFNNEIELKLTEKSLEMLNEVGLKIYSTRNKKRSDVINPNDIVAKELIYNEKEYEQLSMLKDLLKEENLNNTQCRLIEKGLPQGVTILFHGCPGTGKTESVYQIAQATGRQIMKVDISNTKSAFFGESEKKIKKIFTYYQVFAKECSIMPILLFNEADAIFSKRKDIGSSNVAATENNIQNIILDEMENFDGILIATTNLTNNLDKAFERRFLFKMVAS